jgi:hypothetical protein
MVRLIVGKKNRMVKVKPRVTIEDVIAPDVFLEVWSARYSADAKMIRK